MSPDAALRAAAVLSKSELLAASGVLLVLREPPPLAQGRGQPAAVPGDPAEGPEILLAVWDDGSATALNGHVDLGTGLRTALTHIVAEELELPLAQVVMRLGDTAAVPNQGATIASVSLQIHAQPLRWAAAQARLWQLQQSAAGEVKPWSSLLAGHQVRLWLDPQTPTKPVADYTVVGQSVPRVELEAKLRGEASFVHDLRLPGMLHGRVLRPPYAGADHGDFIGNTLEAVDESSIAHIPGIRAVVVIRDFVGIVAEHEEQAEQALAQLQVRWKPWPGLPDQQDAAQAIRANPRTTRELVNDGDVDAALAGAGHAMSRSYVWPYQLHGSLGPSCAVADWQAEEGAARLKVWAGTQNPFVLRRDLALLTGLAATAVEVVRLEAAGCYGRNGADDVAADAALLARAVAAPVRVQLTRAQENLWEPKGAAQLMEVRGALSADGGIAAYDFETSYPSNGAPTLALLLTRTVEPVAQAFEMGDRTARPPYAIANLRVRVHDMAPLVRASWLRGVSALPNAFAHESFVDELASAAGVDPVDYRLRHLHDARAVDLVRATATRAGWKPHTQPQQQASDGPLLRGQGFAYARYMHSQWPGFGAAWAAWVADVEVNRDSGEVHVRRVVVGQDAGLLVNPAGVEQQLHGNVLQTTSRALKEQLQFEPGQQTVANREWGSYPILNFREVPVIDVLHMARPGEPMLGVGESASVPGTAAIANAIFDATGVRLREPPFTPERVRAALKVPEDVAHKGFPATKTVVSGLARDLSWPRRRSLWAGAAALGAGVLTLSASLLGWRAEIAPVSTSSSAIYTEALIARGRVLAALGDCAVCHTVEGGLRNAGGRAFVTPFGTVYSSNLTPDRDTGLGQWSFSAFQRAMREGRSRDGHQLYPAFPYTAFAKTSDDDLQALYAYLMVQPPVRAETPPAQMRFPFGARSLMAGWNALFHEAKPYAPEAGRSEAWNRGAYLVNGLGHCGACHTPRNVMGAEQGGVQFLAGALVDGWEAPALTQASKAPLRWTEQALFDYLRRGHSSEHGAVAGPMVEVVRELAAVPDDDVRAMATYLASFNPAQPAPSLQTVVHQAAAQHHPLLQAGGVRRLFETACGACHHDGDGPQLLGLNLPLALSSKLHSAYPDNLIRVLLEGVRQPATREIGFMPAFADSLSNTQIAKLLAYMRQRYAPQQPPWTGLEASVARLRSVVAAR